MPGITQFLRGQLSTPPQPDVDFSGRTVIVTGANSGLGLDAAKLLSSLNCSTIVLACRNLSKAQQAKEEVIKSSSAEKKASSHIIIMELDLESFASVVAFAERCKDLPRIDGIIMNAGVAMTEFQVAEGYEKTITVNVISTFLLATLLVPVLRASATKFSITPDIAVVGSAVHFWANSKALTKPAKGQILHALSDSKQADMSSRYFLSKLPVMLVVQHLAQILAKSAEKDPASKPMVVLNNVAPGYCKTNLLRHDDSMGKAISMVLIGRSSEHGARTLVHGVSAGKETNGQYLSECKILPASSFVRSSEGDITAQKIWDELTAIFEKVKPGCTQVL